MIVTLLYYLLALTFNGSCGVLLSTTVEATWCPEILELHVPLLSSVRTFSSLSWHLLAPSIFHSNTWEIFERF